MFGLLQPRILPQARGANQRLTRATMGVDTMPLYLDVHDRGEGQRDDALRAAHQQGLEIQRQLGAKYLKCWYDERSETVQYLLAAPTLEAARAVHCQAHNDAGIQIVELDESALWRTSPRTIAASRPASATPRDVRRIQRMDDWFGTRRLAHASAVLAIGLTIALFGGGSAAAQQPAATAELRDSTGGAVGTATFSQVSNGVQVSGTFRGLPPGEHGIHVHAVGQCDAPDFMTAGPHWNPTNRQHGLRNPQGAHLGDLPNLTVGADGSGTINALAQGATLGTGNTSMLDADGSALVIHANADDDVTDPSGNSGGRIACGVVASAQTQPAAKPGAAPAAKPAAQPAAQPAAKPAPAQVPGRTAQAPAALPRTGASLPIPEILATLGGVTLAAGLTLRRFTRRG